MIPIKMPIYVVDDADCLSDGANKPQKIKPNVLYLSYSVQYVTPTPPKKSNPDPYSESSDCRLIRVACMMKNVEYSRGTNEDGRLCRNILLKVLPGTLNPHVFGSQY
jgi:hypothetical protein